jgi:Domain of unknown function (DUF5610)
MSSIGQVGAGSVNLDPVKDVQSGETDAVPETAVSGDTVRLSPDSTMAEIKHQTDQELMKNLASFMANLARDNGGKLPGLDSPLSITTEMMSTPLGQRLNAMLSEYGVDLGDAIGIDYSADATSTRIVDFATSLYGTFQSQHPELKGEDLISAFEDTVRGAVDEGYGQARTFLDGKGVPGEVVSLGDETMSLVHQKFDGFFENLRSGAAT